MYLVECGYLGAPLPLQRHERLGETNFASEFYYNVKFCFGSLV